MNIFTTWIDADQRFSFSLERGEKSISTARHTELLQAESRGNALRPDPVTGLPIIVERVALALEEVATAIYDQKVQEINAACEARISDGFWSSALGGAFFYDSRLEDQLNLTGIIQAGTDSAYPCRDEKGVKVFRDHTAAQLQQVGEDFIQIKLQLLRKANDLKQTLDAALAALDVAAIEAVIWESGSL
ncbi:hypothetical protein HU762_22305 [Pseudomonas sp. SWRI92]|uniref:DUF4376 domain-containing protein n=1 Tax=Pseudomonas sp. SWRI92 TaxID=2745499 RepID=UPI001647EB50|nr:hypothetical protein [Pseudomonas sp. SWRI92]MBC3376678.1 hypothetical protein [Pseudomonas sp. SWRI92]